MSEQRAIAEFLTARLAEDESDAHIAGESAGYSWTEHEQVVAIGGKPRGSEYLAKLWFDHAEEGSHIARHDPERSLREVESKRAILVGFENYEPDDPHTADTNDLTLMVLKALAAAYSDHADYQEEWRP